MAEYGPDTPQPLSLRAETPAEVSLSAPAASGRIWMVMAIMLGVAFLVALVLLASSGGDSSLSEAQVRDIVGTQVASTVLNGGNDSGLSAAQMQQMIDSAVGTQVAALRPTATPIPPTPTVIPDTHYQDDDAFRGPADAPVVIVEFSDFQCGYCGRWYQNTLPRILEAYPTQVKFIYRDFPIFGEESVLAAMATECAEEQDPEAFWGMHNRLFDRLTAQEQSPLNAETLTTYAADLGLDTAAFATCLSDQRYLDEVANDFRAAQSYGLGGTPGFVINGVVYAIGAQSFEVFQGLIESELARAQAG